MDGTHVERARRPNSSSNGAEAVSRLYAPNRVLVGFVTAIDRSQICGVLRGIIGQGWTSIRIKIVNVRQIGGLILIANEYTAIGSGQNAAKTLNAAASHVLVESDGEWLSTLHTAR
jgi:hypothetical protein